MIVSINNDDFCNFQPQTMAKWDSSLNGAWSSLPISKNQSDSADIQMISQFVSSFFFFSKERAEISRIYLCKKVAKERKKLN